MLNYDFLPNSTSIRLLSLRSRQGSADELSGTLNVFDLASLPLFRALSYTWGPPYRDLDIEEVIATPLELSARITCNGSAVPITQNLFDALISLRDSRAFEWIWTDALCINQKDIAERSSQVLLMEYIYSSAGEVLVWLGLPRDGLDEYVWATTKFIDALGIKTANGSLYGQTGNIFDPEFQRQTGIGDLVPKFNKLAYFYAECRWFSRLWIVQEVMLARHVRVFSGQVELSFRRMGELASMLRATGWISLLKPFVPKTKVGRTVNWFEEIFTWHQTLAIEDPWAKAGGKEEEAWRWLLNSLCFGQRSTCFDKRDKVYGVLGIAGRQFKQIPIGQYIQPDYSVSAKDLYIAVTMELFKHMKSMDLLALVGDRTADPDLAGLPSWALQFTPPSSRSFLSVGPSMFDASLCILYSGHDKRQITTTTLTCQGAKFQTIVEVQEKSLEELLETHSATLIAVFSLALPPQIKRRRRFEVLWRTLIGNTTAENTYPAPLSYERSFVQFIVNECGTQVYQVSKAMDVEEAISWVADALSLYDIDNGPGKGLGIDDVKNRFHNLQKFIDGQGPEKKAAAQILEKMDEEAMPFGLAMVTASTDRRLFRTEGGFLGMGPLSTQVGDQV